ncbi:Guanine nucleotide-binding protein-like 1 [Grifola frondosa]|uniref:Guanine nucleotide-binding protein-like 1 n=1 Tax=Grifola frondosa TaxID=5627 RepID=A0A1C7MRB2_GRIFR|nr:Guanine nucleotide-binding protein-like 1 [Grifola frondosa]
MHRRKPISNKQRKAQLQLKRAVKRGDVSPPPPLDRHGKIQRKGPTGQAIGPSSRTVALADSSRRLQSSFVKLPQRFLEDTKLLASTLPLSRPIPPDAAILHDVDKGQELNINRNTQLTCPKRPKWRYDMSKKEVEANEEGLFKKWLAQTDTAVTTWCSADTSEAGEESTEGIETPKNTQMPCAPTSFERNLEVWRQLWRVTEISQILLILLDSRCPTLHLPPSLSSYLASFPHARKVLVLTKVDISGPERAEAWSRYLHTLYPGARVVQVESYIEKSAGVDGSSGKKAYEPYLPSAFRQTLVDALREAHAELLTPPEAITENPDKLQNWKPRVKREVHWDAVLMAEGGQVGTAVGGVATPRNSNEVIEDSLGDDNAEVDHEPEFLTIGLIDCPGLVMPNYVPMEMQVLSGILPISRVSAVPLCIHFAAQLLPLEQIYNLVHPSLAAPAVEDRRTWREGMRSREQSAVLKENGLPWTAMDVLTAYANKKGWVTAKAGRPDVNRAGNAILRALAERKIRWAFWPPGTDAAEIEPLRQGVGIWLPHATNAEADSDSDSEFEETTAQRSDSENEDAPLHNPEDTVVGLNEEETEHVKLHSTAGRFGALRLEDSSDDNSGE